MWIGPTRQSANFGDRLDLKGVAMLIDGGLQDFRGRSSSAWAKKLLTSFRIPLAAELRLNLALRCLETSILHQIPGGSGLLDHLTNVTVSSKIIECYSHDISHHGCLRRSYAARSAS